MINHIADVVPPEVRRKWLKLETFNLVSLICSFKTFIGKTKSKHLRIESIRTIITRDYNASNSYAKRYRLVVVVFRVKFLLAITI